MGKHEERVFQCWVTIDRVSLPRGQWRYLVSDRDPARFDASSLRIKNPFSYQALKAELVRFGIMPALIPPESYFVPTADEKEERAEMIFRKVPALTGWRK